MPDPVVVPCPADVWTEVATNVMSGVIHALSTEPRQYLQTYRLAASAAPTDNDDAVPFTGPLQISNSAAIDVYIQAVGKAGSVRVDT